MNFAEVVAEKSKKSTKGRKKMLTSSTLNKYMDLVDEVVEELVDSTKSDNLTMKKVELMSTYVDMKDINPICDSTDRMSDYGEIGMKYVTIWLLKAILDIDILRDLCLMPPAGISLNQWRCFLGPCTFKIWDAQNPRGLKKLRKHCRREFEEMEGIEEDFFENWSGRRWTPRESERENVWISCSHTQLFPVRALHNCVREAIIAKDRRLEQVVDSLFVCRQHFKETETSVRIRVERPKATSRRRRIEESLNLKTDETFYKRVPTQFTVELLNHMFENNLVKFSFGKVDLSKRDITVFENLKFDYKCPEVPERVDGLREMIKMRISGMLEDYRQSELVQVIDQIPSGWEQQ